jgi:hypothetical protein
MVAVARARAAYSARAGRQHGGRTMRFGSGAPLATLSRKSRSRGLATASA